MVHVACMFYIEIHFYKLALTLRSFTLVVMDLVTFPKLKIVEGIYHIVEPPKFELPNQPSTSCFSNNCCLITIIPP